MGATNVNYVDSMITIEGSKIVVDRTHSNFIALRFYAVTENSSFKDQCVHTVYVDTGDKEAKFSISEDTIFNIMEAVDATKINTTE